MFQTSSTVRSVGELEANGCLLVQDGNHGEYRPRRNEFVASGVAYIRAADMSGGRVKFESAERISTEAVARIRKGIGASGDVLVSHKGTVGKVARVPVSAPPFVCSPQTTFWRSLDPEILDQTFLYYYLSSSDFGAQLDSRKGETDMADYVSLTEQRRLTIPIPPIEEQKRIAGLLSVFEDALERSSTIARKAQALLAAIWRVSQEGKPGQIARTAKISDHAKQVRDLVQPAMVDSATPYIGLEHMPRGAIWLSDWAAADKVSSSKFAFRKGDILFGKLRPYFRKVGVALTDGICSTDILVIRPIDVKLTPLVLMALSDQRCIDYATARSDGTRMPRTSWSDLSDYQVVVPATDTSDLLERVGGVLAEVANAIFERQRRLRPLLQFLLEQQVSSVGHGR